mmetsp:Transcript_45020/g.128578  ORF Transcript_45020/g.128578 Transcript_45020/m.128578 type:complete len:378 (-) Transcript_45020:214-1347(-)
MELRGEGAGVRALGSPGLELHGDGGRQQLLGLDLRHLDVAVRVAVEQQLRANEVRQVAEGRRVLRREHGHHAVFRRGDARSRELVVDLGDEAVELGDKLDEALGQDDDAVLLPDLAPGLDHVGELLREVAKALLVTGDLLTQETGVRPREQGHLEGDVRGRATHEPDQVVVFLRAERVDRDVAHEVGVGLAGRVEAEGDGDVRRALEVAVDGLGGADHLRLAAVGLEVLSQNCAVGVGVVAADDHEAVEVDALADRQRVLELLLGLNLVPAAAQHVKAASVAEAVHDLVADLHKVAAEYAMRPIKEPDHGRILMPVLDAIEDASDNVVTPRSLTARQHYADLYRAVVRAIDRARRKFHQRRVVRRREQTLDRLGFLR